MKKKLFINDDFINSQYLWIIPIIDGFCKKNKIRDIILLKKFPKKILNVKFVKKFTQEYSIQVIEKNDKSKFLNLIQAFLIIFNNLSLLFKLFIKSPLENKKNWFHLQLNHSIWDYSNVLMDEKKLKKSFLIKLYSLIVCLKKIDLGKYLIKKNISHAFIGHSVYFSRALMAKLRENNVKIYNQTNFTIYKQPKDLDTFWSEIKKNDIKKLKKVNINLSSKKYWLKRIKGLGTYKDTQIALKKTSKIEIKDKNFIFLHIFRDSPFNIIDKTRIFDDYFHWFIETIRIINNSQENWYIKLHPSHILWGENQRQIIDTILKKNKINLNKNIKIESIKLSNQEIFKHAKRIVTFSGTPHLEVAAYGIKPIVISKNTLESFDNSKVHKPKSLNEYKRLLLKNSSSKIFKLNRESKLIARKLLYFRENISSLKEDLKSFTIYRKDTKRNIKKEFSIIKHNSGKYYNKLYMLGYNLNKINKTISFKYLKFFK